MLGNGRYPAELRERTVRMVLDNDRLYGSQWEAICSVADKLGPAAETVRLWVRRAEIDHAALGRLPLAWLALLHLRGDVQAEVGMACALLSHAAHTEDLGAYHAADCVQQIGQRWVVREFTSRTPRGSNAKQVLEVVSNRPRQLRNGCCQGLPSCDVRRFNPWRLTAASQPRRAILDLRVYSEA